MTTSPIASSRTARTRRACCHATPSALSDADPVDDAGRRPVGLVRKDHDRAPELFDDGRLGQELAGVVAALDEDVGTYGADEAARVVLAEGDDVVDARQRRQHLDAVLELVDRPLVAL